MLKLKNIAVVDSRVCEAKEGEESIPHRMKSYGNSAVMAILKQVHNFFDLPSFKRWRLILLSMSVAAFSDTLLMN